MPAAETQENGARAKAALLARLARLYHIRTQGIVVGDREFTIAGVADPDQVLLDMERGIRASGAEQPRWQPYWAQSWESALALAHCLVERCLDGQDVLDLGCGLGLAGTVAAAQGAQVVLADAAHPALLFARYNAWPWRARVETTLVDWRQTTLDRRFNVIVGADIVYDVSDWPFLDAFWKRHLQPGGELLLGEPSRDSADAITAFLESSGWAVRTWNRENPNRKRPIRILSCKEKSEAI